MRKVIYYYDENNDDFAGTNINQKPIEKKFKYVRDKNFLWHLCSIILYYVIAKPIALLFVKIGWSAKIKNKKALKRIKRKQGYFMYCNHSSMIPDAFQPSLVKFSRRAHIIVNPDCTSIPGIQNIVMMLGAVPLPNTMDSKINFLRCIRLRMAQGRCVTIYPEAHIWPYYTKLRDFSADVFHYPVKLNVPSYALTTCYSRHRGLLRLFKKPKIVSYLDGPFYPDSNLNPKDAAEDLKRRIKQAMQDRLDKHSTYEYVKYIKVDDPSKVTKL